MPLGVGTACSTQALRAERSSLASMHIARSTDVDGSSTDGSDCTGVRSKPWMVAARGVARLSRAVRVALAAALLGYVSAQGGGAPIIVDGGWGVSVALLQDGTLYRWGRETRGINIAGSTEPQTIHVAPIAVNLRHSVFIDVAAGHAHVLALRDDGRVASWGLNISGELGYGTAESSWDPLFVSGIQDAVAVAAGGASFAVLADGSVAAWGSNLWGKIGLADDTYYSLEPVRVPGIASAIAVASGGDHTLALLRDGTVLAWGWNEFGQLGDGSAGGWRGSPELVLGLSNVVAIDAGSTHSLALLDDGSVMAWGRNEFGMLGNGSRIDSPVPVRVHGVDSAISIAAGTIHSLALLHDGSVMAWGENSSQGLGDGTRVDRDRPVRVLGLRNVESIGAGFGYSLAVVADGTMRAWGANRTGELGVGFSNGSIELPLRVIGPRGASSEPERADTLARAHAMVRDFLTSTYIDLGIVTFECPDFLRDDTPVAVCGDTSTDARSFMQAFDRKVASLGSDGVPFDPLVGWSRDDSNLYSRSLAFDGFKIGIFYLDGTAIALLIY